MNGSAITPPPSGIEAATALASLADAAEWAKAQISAGTAVKEEVARHLGRSVEQTRSLAAKASRTTHGIHA
jgi:hypothetical protein